MAHVVEDIRTAQYLKDWSGGRKIYILSYFFWLAGHGLQNNITGLLKNLLWQMCNGSSTATATVSDSTREESPTWNIQRLINATLKVIDVQAEYFCIFIDGLPESTEDYPTLVELLREYKGASKSDIHAMTAVCHIAAAQMTEGVSSYLEFESLCEDKEVHINAQNAGLLELKTRSEALHTAELSRNEWNCASLKFAMPPLRAGDRGEWEADASGLNYLAIKGSMLDELQKYPSALSYEDRHLTLIHRSAYNNVVSGEGKSILHMDVDKPTALDRILVGIFKHLVIAPSCSGPPFPPRTHGRLNQLIKIVWLVYHNDQNLLSAFLHRVEALVACIDSAEFDWTEALDVYRQAGAVSLGRVVFWREMFFLDTPSRTPLVDFYNGRDA